MPFLSLTGTYPENYFIQNISKSSVIPKLGTHITQTNDQNGKLPIIHFKTTIPRQFLQIILLHGANNSSGNTQNI